MTGTQELLTGLELGPNISGSAGRPTCPICLKSFGVRPSNLGDGTLICMPCFKLAMKIERLIRFKVFALIDRTETKP